MANYALVIPTYNRPSTLRRLLHFFRAYDQNVPIIVLDSSQASFSAEVTSICEGVQGVVRERYEENTPFYTKLADGVRRNVKTPAACLCADDDLVIPDALDTAARIVLDDEDTAVAHGYYAQFALEGGGRLTGLLCSGAEITRARPLQRVAEGLMCYMATLYGVHRKDLLVEILDEAARAPNLFTAELLTTVLALYRGKTRRIPIFTHARNIGPSHHSVNWHPTEMLAVDPRLMVEGFAFIRERLAARIGDSAAKELRLFDLGALSYVSDYVRPAAMRRLTKMAIEGRPDAELREFGWAEFAAMSRPSGALSSLLHSRAGRWLRQLLVAHPTLKMELRRLLTTSLGGAAKVPVRFDGGRDVSVVFEPAFVRQLAAVSELRGGASAQRLAEAIAAYSQGCSLHIANC